MLPFCFVVIIIAFVLFMQTLRLVGFFFCLFSIATQVHKENLEHLENYDQQTVIFKMNQKAKRGSRQGKRLKQVGHW